MSIAPFKTEPYPMMAQLLDGYSIEVTPKAAAKVPSFLKLLPRHTLIYVAYIPGTDFDDVISTARRIASEGFEVMPHFPARSFANLGALERAIMRCKDEAGVSSALVLGGGASKPTGELTSALELLHSGLFDRAGFKRLHVAGHPEGNRDIDPDGGSRNADNALLGKCEFAKGTDADMAIVTQFMFDVDSVVGWDRHLRRIGVDLPIHVGMAGPTKLQTLIRFSISCGIGASLSVLQKRARDIHNLLTPFEPDEIVSELARYRAREMNTLVTRGHFFPLGGILKTINWLDAATGRQSE